MTHSFDGNKIILTSLNEITALTIVEKMQVQMQDELSIYEWTIYCVTAFNIIELILDISNYR